MRGALSLRAYLDRSDRMLVLLDESYFSRLWCVWEVAAFFGFLIILEVVMVEKCGGEEGGGV